MKNYSLVLMLLAFLIIGGLSVQAQQTISQNNSMSIGIGVGITCNENGINTGGGTINDTHFYRYFDLPNDYNIQTGFTVSSVNFGILWFVSGGSGYPITINIYSAEIGEFPDVDMTLQGSATYTATGSELFALIEHDLNAEIPAGEAMVMEMFLPEDETVSLIPGFNLNGDSKPAYISAETCDIPNPVTVASLNPAYEDLAIVFAVKGYSCDPSDVPYLQDFESADVPDIPVCTVIENAGEGNDWEVFSGNNGEFSGKYIKYEADASNDADAWFYTKGINLTGGETYEISYDYGSSSFPESLKVMYGTSQSHESMVYLLAEYLDFSTDENALNDTIEFIPSESGVYYFGFNAFSFADQGEIYVDNILIELLTEENPDFCSIEYPEQLDGGLGDLQQLIVAADFYIEAGTVMDINQFVVHIFGNITDANIYFYEDLGGGMPGDLITSYYSVAPSSQTYVLTNFGYNIYNNVFDLPESIQLDGGSTGKTYWIGLETTAGSEGTSNFWSKSDSFYGYLPYYSNDGGASWAIDTNNMDLAFTLNGECGDLGIKELESFEVAYYPNPVEDVLNLNSEKPIKQAEIISMAGNKVYVFKNPENEKINLDMLNPGIYIVRVILENGQSKSFKIIKK